MAAARSIHPTLHDILQNVSEGRAAVRRGGKSAVDGLKMKPFPHREGIQVLNPEQLLSIRVPVQHVTGDKIKGYQRHLEPYKARKAAEYIRNNDDYLRTMGVCEVSIDGNGNAFFTDGQHRAAGAIIARQPFRVILTKRSEEEARKLFHNQRFATKPSANVLIFDSDGVFEEYIQDAVTDPAHPWNKLITTAQKGTTANRISAAGALGLLRIFVGKGTYASKVASKTEESRFDKESADQLAALLSAFGTKQTNPLAYRSGALRAIAMTALAVFDRPEGYPYQREDEKRWNTHMTRFPFWAHVSVTSSTELALRLKVHWNKNLQSDERKVQL